MDSKAAEGLRRAADFHARGEIDAAVKAAKAVVSRHPRDATALQFLGVLVCQSGNPQKGAGYLERAFRRNPFDPNIRQNLAQALLDAGRIEDADRLLGSHDAALPEHLRLRAEAAKARGQARESIELYLELTRAQPDDAGVWNNLGNLFAEVGEMEQALVSLRRASTLDPQNAIVFANLGRILHGLKQPDESREMLEQAIRLTPADSNALFELGELLRRLDHPQHALAAFSSAARLNPRDPKVYVNIGLSFAAIPDRKQAEQAYRMALHVDCHFGPAYLNLGILLEQENRTEELKDLAEEACAYGVTGGEMDYISALVLRRTGDLEGALRLAQNANTESLDPAVRAHFIGLVADRLGETEAAFGAFREMNQLTAASPAGAVFTGDEHRHEVMGIAEATTEEWFAAWRSAKPKSEPPAPAFLMGFLRSGTTLLDTILMGHPDTHVLEEDPILAHLERAGGSLDRLASLGDDEINRLRDRYFEALERKGDPAIGRLVIDKNPLAALRAPLIHRIFPDARFIFALRHPCDVILSCYMQNFRASQAMASFFDLEKAALFYDAVMSYWEKCRDLMPLNVHTIRYEDLVDDVEAEVRPLLDYLGLEWNENVLDHQRTAADRGYIRTPSYAQVTEKIYRRSRGRWTLYREYMAPTIPILRPWAEKFGYEID